MIVVELVGTGIKFRLKTLNKSSGCLEGILLDTKIIVANLDKCTALQVRTRGENPYTVVIDHIVYLQYTPDGMLTIGYDEGRVVE